MLDQCGGHTKDYHNHERLVCLYDVTASGHSAKVGEALDGTPIHGKCRSTRVRSTGGVAPRVSLYHETLHGEVADFF